MYDGIWQSVDRLNWYTFVNKYGSGWSYMFLGSFENMIRLASEVL